MEDLSSSTRMHRMTMTNRKNCTINGVRAEVDLDGRIDSFTYSDAAGSGHKGESLLSKLFR